MTKDDATWLNISYVVFAALVAYVSHQGLAWLGFEYGWAERYAAVFPVASVVASLSMGAGVALWARHAPERRQYHLNTIAELRRVTWPSLDDTKRMTIVVVVVVGIFAVILALFDVVLSKILQYIVS